MRTNLHKRIGFAVGLALVGLIWLLAAAMLVKEPQIAAVTASQSSNTAEQVVAAAPQTQTQDVAASNAGGPAIQALGGSLNEARIAEAQQAYGQPQAVADAPAANIMIADSGTKIDAPAPVAPAPIVAPPDGSPVQIVPPQAQVPNQIVVQFNPNATTAERAAYITSIGGVIVQELPALNSAVISVTVRADTPLSSPAIVAQTEPNYTITALEEPMQNQQWALPVIGAPSAWADLNADAPLVTVAVIDSGVCLEHPDLAERTVAGYDFVDGDTTAQDDFGHGCSVAGIIAADGSNGQGIAGVAPNARIMPLRVLNAQGIGQYSNVAAAIVYAADNGAQIINLSLGGAYASTILEDAITYAVDHGVTVIAAAGNNSGPVMYPAAYAPVIAVGSVDQNLERSSFSSYGPQLDTLAPGRDVLTTTRDGGYSVMTGTSFAAPQVAGIAALEIGHGRVLVTDGGLVHVGGEIVVIEPTPEATTEPVTYPVGEYFEGVPEGYMVIQEDILVPENYYELRAQGAYTTGGLWPGGIVPYEFVGSVTQANRDETLAAMAEWEASAGIDFIPRNGHADYIYIFNASGNFSMVGRTGGGQQLGMYNWNYRYIIAHELGHALGLWHEQSRPDRETYVQIVYANIISGYEGNFDIEASNLYGTPYDFDSVMHYGGTFFTNNGQNTIVMRPAYANCLSYIGQRNHLSYWDKYGMNQRYPGGAGASGSPINCAGAVVPPPNDDFAAATVIQGMPFSVSQNTTLATTDTTDLPNICTNTGRSKTVWYKFTPLTSRTVYVNTEGSSYDTVIAVYTGTENSQNQVACDDDSGTEDRSSLSFSATGGTTYYMVASAYGNSGSGGSLVFNVGYPAINTFTPSNNSTINTTQGDPTYSWNHVGADYYYLYVESTTGVQFANEAIAAVGYCNATTCSYNPTVLHESTRLYDQAYRWYIRTFDNGILGPSYGPINFTLNAPSPTLVNLDSTTGASTLRPTINWTASGNATAFRLALWSMNGSNFNALAYYDWITRPTACGSLAGTSCSFQLPLNLINGTQYSAFIQTASPGGWTTIGGPYGNGYQGDPIAGPDEADFIVGAPLPSIPTGLSVDYTEGAPVFSWNDVASAASFNVYIGNYSTNVALNWGTNYHFKNYPRTTGAGGLCNGGTCRLEVQVVLNNGAYNFAVNAVNGNGASADGTYGNGYGGVENRVLNFATAPAAPNAGFSPTTTITTGRPTFTWDTVANAVSYQLWVGTVTPTFTVSHQMWYWAAAPNCTPHPGTCSITPDLNLPEGNNWTWNVQAYGPGGTGNWVNLTVGIPFVIDNNIPGLVTVGSPDGDSTIFDNTPDFTWTDIPSADWYNIWIGRPDLSVLHTQWYRAERGAGKLCNGGTCSLNVPGLLLLNGDYWWNIQASSPAGIGSWQAHISDYGDFTVGIPTPGAPTLNTPSNSAVITTTNRPTFSWNTVNYSLGYYLEITNTMGGLVYGATYYSDNPVCDVASCTVQLPNPIAYGSYNWRVIPGNNNGAGTISATRSFVALSMNTVPLMVQSGDGKIAQNGQWTTAASEQAIEGDYLVSTAGTESVLTMTFEGTQANLVYVTSPSYGTFAIEIDGVMMQGINAYSEALTFNNLTTVGDLAAGVHTLRIIPLAGASVGIDAIVVDGQVTTQSVAPTPAPTVAPIDPTPEPTIAPIEPTQPTPEPTIAPAPEATPEATAAQ